jgi:hypothetical protein
MSGIEMCWTEDVLEDLLMEGIIVIVSDGES